MNLKRALTGCLVGAAVGDALGLPYERISRRRQRRMFPSIAEHRFLLGRGMVSDDTEHACMTAQALIVSGAAPQLFARSLSWRLRWWLLGLPAGLGSATLRAILKLWIGFPPSRSGVSSAGNGPAMRSPAIGVACGDDLDRMRELIRVSSRLTHTDARAEEGAAAVGLAAYLSSRQIGGQVDPDVYFQKLLALLPDAPAEDLLRKIERAVQSAKAGESAVEFADSLGLDRGVTGFTNHTVPIVLQVWLRCQEDYRSAVLEVIACGGDTDTTAAILGGIVGARTGIEGIPAEWSSRVLEWPRSLSWTERLAARLAESRVSGESGKALPLFWPAIPVRNLLFLLVVLLHGCRRLLPPY